MISKGAHFLLDTNFKIYFILPLDANKSERYVNDKELCRNQRKDLKFEIYLNVFVLLYSSNEVVQIQTSYFACLPFKPSVYSFEATIKYIVRYCTSLETDK